MIFINKGGRVVYVNRKCEEIMGYARGEFYAPDFDFMKLIVPEYIPMIRQNFAKHTRGEEVEPYEYALLTKEKKIINSIINTKLIRYEGENSILGIVTDITEHKKAMEALRISERNLARAQRIARIGSWVRNTENNLLHWSDEMYNIHGIDKKTAPTDELLQRLIYPEDLPRYERAFKDLFAGSSPQSFEYRVIKPGGVIAHVQATGETQFDNRGKLSALIGTVQDITERKIADELREKLITDLQKAAREIKTLSGFIPICASCKKIRDDKGYWEQIEIYIMERSDAEFSHGLCPECSKKLYPDL
jgi:PAS domain S-box-containing protein